MSAHLRYELETSYFDAILTMIGIHRKATIPGEGHFDDSVWTLNVREYHNPAHSDARNPLGAVFRRIIPNFWCIVCVLMTLTLYGATWWFVSSYAHTAFEGDVQSSAALVLFSIFGMSTALQASLSLFRLYYVAPGDACLRCLENAMIADSHEQIGAWLFRAWEEFQDVGFLGFTNPYNWSIDKHTMHWIERFQHVFIYTAALWQRDLKRAGETMSNDIYMGITNPLGVVREPPNTRYIIDQIRGPLWKQTEEFIQGAYWPLLAPKKFVTEISFRVQIVSFAFGLLLLGSCFL